MKGGLPSLRVLRQFLFVPSVLNSSAMTEREKLNKITEAIIGAAIQVHRALGPGLLESAYVACLAYELKKEDSSLHPLSRCRSGHPVKKYECSFIFHP